MTTADLVLDWARAFAVTLAVELAVAVPLLARHAPALPRRLALVTFAQLASHPIVWFVLPAVVAPRPAYLVVAETWACASEALFYAIAVPSLGPRTSLVVAVLANAASLTVGLALRGLGVNV